MLFSSSIFLVYFLPVLLLVYFLIGNRFKNYFLLLASIVFYSWGAPKFIFVILGTTALDFYLVQWLSRAESERKRKLLLVLSLSLNLGLLFYFKYCNFFIDNLNSVLGTFGAEPVKWLEVVLPIGISFYTFESLTYVMDVYRKVHKPLNSFLNYQLYILLFPKLIAGPIIRYHEISDQITGREGNYTAENRLNGFYRFAIGLGKKVMIANTMAVVADRVFNLPADQLNSGMVWLGALAYTFQIYFDFSGYSDMAIGLGKMLGFIFPENFDNPYTSKSITEFWRRWHITLGSWMKNYLYIPLGGNNVNSKARLYFNLWLVFLASGFWHGASWTFIIWGAYHGLFLILERLFLLKVYDRMKIFAVVPVFIITVIGWVFFRANTVDQALVYLKQMFSFSSLHIMPGLLNPKFLFYSLLALVFSFFVLVPYGKILQERFYFLPKSALAHTIFVGVCLAVFVLSLSSITTSGFNPFIYFRF